MDVGRRGPRPVIPRLRTRLTLRERARVAVEIVTAYARIRWWLFRRGFPAVVSAARAVGDTMPAAPDEAVVAAVRLGEVVQRTLRLLPFDARCLVRSLVLTRLLARRGIDSTFVLGVKAKPEFAAHAWLEIAGVAVLPTGPDFHRIAEL